MSYSLRQVALCRVQLELNSNPSHRHSRNQNRASLCYSANLKKRTDVLNAQRQGIAQCLQKPQNNNEKHTGSSKNLAPAFYPQKRHGHLITGSKSLYHKNQPVQSIKAIQQIKVQAKRYQNNDKQSEQKKIKNQVLHQYGTIKSQVFEDEQCQSPTLHVDASQFMKTCPDFGILKNQKLTKRRCINNSESKNKNKTDSLIFSNNKQSMSSKSKGQSNKFILKENNYAKKRLTENIISMKDLQNKLDLFPQKKQHLNRVETAPNSSTAHQESSQQHTMRIFQNPYHKQIYKTSNINLSDHFSNVQERGSFPICKKMTMSSVNKYYQLCIQQIKTRGMKRDQNVPGTSQKIDPSQQKINNQSEKSKTLELKQQLMNLQSLNNTEAVKNHKELFLEVKNPDKLQVQLKNKQDSAKAINYNKIENKNNIAFQIGSESQTDYRPLLTTTKVYKFQKPQKKQIIADFQKGIDKDQSLGFVRCSKKQLVDRVSILDPYKKNVFNNINKGQIKKFNTDDVEQDLQFCQLDEPKSPTRSPKLNRTKSTTSPKKQRHQIQQEAPLAAWDLNHNADQNFPNPQFNLEEIN